MNKLLVVILLMPLLMGFEVQDEDEEGGMGGTGHSRGVPVDLPGTPEIPEIMDAIPTDILDNPVFTGIASDTEAADDITDTGGLDSISIDVTGTEE